MVAGETLRPRPASFRGIRRYFQVGVSAAKRSTRARMVGLIGGRPGLRLGFILASVIDPRDIRT
ncbi:MAG: hypothetical protein JWL97_3455 [Gemmatimonadales bacterium]|nr:hypothetical protein [Gemmatimonadales bacterium]